MASSNLIEIFASLLKPLFDEQREYSAPLLPGAAEALLAWSLCERTGKTVVVMGDGLQSLETKHQDLSTLAPRGNGPRLLYYPASEGMGTSDGQGDPDVAGHRLAVLATLARASAEATRTSGAAAIPSSVIRPPFLIATCVQALMQRTLPPEALLDRTLRLSLGAEADLAQFCRQITECGYSFETEVVEKGKATLKGGLLDLWPLTEPWPVRLEFYGAVVESIRAFDPETQRSVTKLNEVVIAPAREDFPLPSAPAREPPRRPPETTRNAVPPMQEQTPGPEVDGRQTANTVLSYLPADAVFLWADMGSIRYHASLFEELAAESGNSESCMSFHQLQSEARRGQGARQVYLETESEPGRAGWPLDLRPLNAVSSMSREVLQPDAVEQRRANLLSDLRARAAAGQTVVLFFDTAGGLDRFSETLGGADTKADGALETRVGILSGGFVSEPARLVVVAECDLYGGRKRADRRYDPAGERPRAARGAGLRVADITDLEPGDFVVHVEHGVGRYLGLHEIVFDGRCQEVLTVEYAEGAKLHVPVSHAHLLSRYVGLSRRHIQLHRLGGRRWKKDKADAEHAIADMAADLLETQAHRRVLAGHAFPPDAPWQHEFEGSFPYRETSDQLAVIGLVKADMESSKPMDRLVCGDAGYGKTEVALRAAFKAVTSGKQVAVLVPTTVLAQQHYETFSARMAAYPLRVEMLSRFCTRGQQNETLRAMREGAVDVVIGTHALLQPGVGFKDLGMVIIDEEQRFGVAHKERFKQMRRLVDVLTLTATPIPRTLYMSLTGARDMSLLQTPPRERMAIETIVVRNTDGVVREAILREINREGQVFYLHNRVMTIDQAGERLRRLVPEARVRVGHGQMSSSELAAVMQAFAAGEFDVLLCTTIVESGLDVPRANTILIDRADRFGIAELYQLRGRVGRSNRRAYAYLLLPSHGLVDPDARRRIGAVKKYSSLSAGFSLALRDLEIRGGGNMLGRAQSGHITAVGFALYCQLLQRTVARLKGEPAPPVIDVEVRLDFLDLSPAAAAPENSAFVPYAYVEDERLRIAVYRRMAEAASTAAVDGLRSELRDRYGPVPPSVERLLKVAELRLVCFERGIRQIETRDGKVMFKGAEDYLMAGSRFPRLAGRTTDEKLGELLDLAKSSERWRR